MEIFKYLSDCRDGGWPLQKNGQPDAFELIFWASSDAAGFCACSAQLEQELRRHWALQRYRPERTDHLNLILANLIVADGKRHRKGFKFHRRADAYARSTAQWPEFLSARTLGAVVDGLETLGYVEKLPGFFDPASRTGFLSQARATDKLRELLGAVGVGPADVKPAPESPLVVLRGEKARKGLAPFVEPIHSEKFKAIENRVRAYADYLSRQSISLDFEPEPRGAMDCRVHRVFNNETPEKQTLSRGGRFYGAFWHHIEREDRSKLLINGEPTVELDFGSMHIRMIYHLNGMQCDGHPYEIPAIGEFLDDPLTPGRRDFVKELTNRLINSNGYQMRELGTATRADVEREFGVRLKDGLPLKVALDAIRKVHAPIAKGLSRGIGLTLQNFDSEICDLVHHAMMAQDIPVLSVHDSFIVGRSSEDELRSAMVDSYKTILDTEFEPVIKKVEADPPKLTPVKLEPELLDSRQSTIIYEGENSPGGAGWLVEASTNDERLHDGNELKWWRSLFPYFSPFKGTRKPLSHHR